MKGSSISQDIQWLVSILTAKHYVLESIIEFVFINLCCVKFWFGRTILNEILMACNNFLKVRNEGPLEIQTVKCKKLKNITTELTLQKYINNIKAAAYYSVTCSCYGFKWRVFCYCSYKRMFFLIDFTIFFEYCSLPMMEIINKFYFRGGLGFHLPCSFFSTNILHQHSSS